MNSVATKRPNCRHSLPRYCHAKRGLATVEFALVLAVVVGTVIASVSVLGQHALQTTQRISTLQPTPVASIVSNQQPASGPKSTPIPQQLAASGANPFYVQWLVMLLLACGLVLQSVVTFRQLRRERTSPQDAPGLVADPRECLFEKRQAMLREMSSISEDHQISHLNVGQVMSMCLTVVARTASVDDLVSKLKTEKRHHLIVSDNSERLEGIISDRDLTQRDGKCAADVMTRSCMSVSPQTDLLAAATTMLNRGISALPVLENDKLVGILTTTDLTLALQCLLLLAKRDDT